jgi:nicotinamide riboside kinase
VAEAASEARSAAVCIAIVGAESTGKTQLAAALAPALAQHTGRRVAWVPEVLRSWCERTGRTPLAHEQAPILRAQHEQIDAAAASHDIVVCDTTALMTAVYSRLIFGDRSLDERAATLHRRRIGATLLTAIDLPWVSDGHQRDGPHVREPVDTALRELMQAHGIGFAVVGGAGPARLTQAMAAVAPVLRGEAKPAEASRGLFTGLGGARRGGWACECCLPDQERALRRAAGPR